MVPDIIVAFLRNSNREDLIESLTTINLLAKDYDYTKLERMIDSEWVIQDMIIGNIEEDLYATLIYVCNIHGIEIEGADITTLNEITSVFIELATPESQDLVVDLIDFDDPEECMANIVALFNSNTPQHYLDVLHNVDVNFLEKLEALVEGAPIDPTDVDALIVGRMNRLSADYANIGSDILANGVSGGIPNHYLNCFKDHIIANERADVLVAADIISIFILTGSKIKDIPDKAQPMLEDYLENNYSAEAINTYIRRIISDLT